MFFFLLTLSQISNMRVIHSRRILPFVFEPCVSEYFDGYVVSHPFLGVVCTYTKEAMESINCHNCQSKRLIKRRSGGEDNNVTKDEHHGKRPSPHP